MKLEKPKIIELVLSAEAVSPEEAVLANEAYGPTSILIVPILEFDQTSGKRHIVFRVAFEPDNPDRRNQPYRDSIKPIFPDGWTYGEPFDSSANILSPSMLLR